MNKLYAVVNPSTFMYEIGIESARKVYFCLVTSSFEEAKRMIKIILEVLA